MKALTISNRHNAFLINTLLFSVCFTMLFLFLGQVRTAQAVDEFAFGGFNRSCFSYPAVAMTPYDRSTQQDLYRMTHERVYHNANATGLILLYGPVQPLIEPFGDGFSFSLTFRDPDGPGDESRVTAELRHIGPAGIQIIATLDSNEHAFATEEIRTMSTPISFQQLDNNVGFYVVRIYITRSNPNLVPAAFGYSLCSTIF